MKIKRFYLVLVIALIATSLSACRLPASTPPVTTPTGSQDFPLPGGVGTETMGVFGTILTQTAAAQQAGGGVASPIPGVTQQLPVQNTPAVQVQDTPIPQVQDTPVPQVQDTPVQQVQDTPVPQPTQQAQPQVVVPTATPGLPSTHTLQQGEFAYCIARRYNINPADLLSANGLGVNTLVYPGTVLRIPQNARPFPDGRELRDHPTTYTVRSGDTIFGIACLYGDVDPNAIAFANDLSAPYEISAGDVLQIP